MPLYEGECRQGCGRFEDVMKVHEYEADGLICPECGLAARTIISAAPTVGPMPSKPLVIDQIGKSFTSRAEMRRYFAARPDRKIVDPNDSSFTNLKDHAHAQADASAKKLGFTDHEDRGRRIKAEAAKKQKIVRGDGKIFSNT